MPTFKMITVFLVILASFMTGHSSAAWNFDTYRGPIESVTDGDESNALTIFGYNGQMPLSSESLLESNLVEEGPDHRYVQHNKRSADDKLYRLCGGHLYNMIRMVCVKQLSNKGKRSIGLDDFSIGLESVNNGWSGTPSSLERFQTTSLIGHRTKRGASTDCCLKPCTISHLATFC